MTDVTERFSSRVENYIRYRPGYPPEVLARLQADCHLTPDASIADIGSGTGILTEIFLRNGNPVYGVEPNSPMREAGERLLSAYPRFTSINGTAEATTLRDASVDFVTAGQAFHWFDLTGARAEFQRILRPQGWVALVWNERQEDTTPFLHGYEHLLQTYGTDYAQVNHKRIYTHVLRTFFPGPFTHHTFPSHQEFNYPALEGRLLSSSYAPEADDPRHAPLLTHLRRLFDTHQAHGTVTFAYDTTLYYGLLPA